VPGRILESLLERKRRGERVHFTLIDPDPSKTTPDRAARIARAAVEAGSDYILVGGSTMVYEPYLSTVIDAVRGVTAAPIILFPGNINGLSPKADAVLYMGLLNSDDPYYIVGARIQAAPIILAMGLEPIPTSYIIVGYGGAAGFIGRARPIPYEKPELVAVHALAGAMSGHRFIYLEAGSGAPSPVPPEAVAASKKLLEEAGLEAILCVGGGVRSPEQARALARAGADALVTGTLAERDPQALKAIVEAFREA